MYQRRADNADNESIASVLDQVARQLELQVSAPLWATGQSVRDVVFRAHAWRHAADIVRQLPEPVARIARDEGVVGLDVLPAIGPGIARAILEIVETGKLALLDRLEQQTGQSATSVKSARATPHRRPAVSVLLDVDAEYRRRAAAGELQKIAPRRLNPTGAFWLPILHTRRGDWRFTALFSNTVLAHRSGHTGDWVVIYFFAARRGTIKTARRPMAKEEHQCTVVTEARGKVAGRRVVRGREAECARWHDNANAKAAQIRRAVIANKGSAATGG